MKVAQLCPTLCDPIDCVIYGILQVKILEWVAYLFSRGIFPTQELNKGLMHCRRILYQLSYQGSPAIRKEGTKAQKAYRKITVAQLVNAELV